MTSYDVPIREQYSIVATAFGATTTSKKFQGPPGKVGLVRDIRVYLSAAAVGTTSVPEVDVGSAQADSSYGRFLLGTTATAGYAAGEYRARSLATNAQGRTGSFPYQLTDFANHICLEGNNASVPSGGTCTAAIPAANQITVNGNIQTNVITRIPADTAFFITGLAGVGGTPAGTGDIDVIIEWY
jgi:hypothetical protein